MSGVDRDRQANWEAAGDLRRYRAGVHSRTCRRTILPIGSPLFLQSTAVTSLKWSLHQKGKLYNYVVPTAPQEWRIAILGRVRAFVAFFSGITLFGSALKEATDSTYYLKICTYRWGIHHASTHPTKISQLVFWMLAAFDGFTFLGVESSLNDDDTRIRRHTRDVCERQLRPFVAELWNTASFDNKIIDACKEIGSAGLQIKGYGQCTWFSTFYNGCSFNCHIAVLKNKRTWNILCYFSLVNTNRPSASFLYGIVPYCLDADRVFHYAFHRACVMII